MLVITRTQMDAINEALRKRFFNRLQQGLGVLFPDLAPRLNRGETLSNSIQAMLSRAAEYGIEDDADLAVFVVIACANLQLFAAKPGYLGWTRTILEREGSDGAAKIGLIEFLLRERAEREPEARELALLCARMREMLHA